jgi:hypothetical protein
MWLIKVLVQSCLIFIFLNFECEAKDYQYAKLKRLKCDPNFKLIEKNFTCFAKPINRNTTGINFLMLFKKPANYLGVGDFF